MQLTIVAKLSLELKFEKICMENSCYVTIMSTSVFQFPKVSEYY